MGFGGEIQIWACRDGIWSKDDAGSGDMTFFLANKITYETDGCATGITGSGEVWAVALSENGQFLAGVSQDGHIKVWDLNSSGEQIQDYETKGSFGTCLDMVGALKASGFFLVDTW